MRSAAGDTDTRSRKVGLKLRRSPNIAAYWQQGEFVLEEFVRRKRIAVTPLIALVLDAFTRSREVEVASSSLSHLDRRAVKETIRALRQYGFLVPDSKSRSEPDVARTWGGSFAAAYYHFSTRDVVYAAGPFDWLNVLGPRLASTRQPPLFKDYKRVPFITLPDSKRLSPPTSLRSALQTRRTVRKFSQSPVSLSAFAGILRGTWGMTGRLEAGAFGKLLAKTSPSAGARHPIECYVFVWNVRGLPAGLYHYSVRRDGLERLRSGDLSDQAVSAASGQAWVGEAAFLCVLTAVVDRVFWKYSSSDAYRLFFLDAGHLAQTFCLLATAAGLGSFTTAAIQESFIENLLAIDGVREFPIYLCGAGTADLSATGYSLEPLR